MTSAVFERLAYLEPAETWSLLAAACDACDGQERARLPDMPPSEAPVWSFWPGLSPGPGGANVRRVEPDVVVTWGGIVLIIEAKHGSAQYSAQWVEEIGAVRAAPAFAGKRVIFVAAGGIESAGFVEQAAEAKRALGEDQTSYLLLRWGKLREVVESRRRGATPGVAAILRDLEAALAAWGYRARVDFGSLPQWQRAASLHITASPKDLADWRVNDNKSR